MNPVLESARAATQAAGTAAKNADVKAKAAETAAQGADTAAAGANQAAAEASKQSSAAGEAANGANHASGLANAAANGAEQAAKRADTAAQGAGQATQEATTAAASATKAAGEASASAKTANDAAAAIPGKIAGKLDKPAAQPTAGQILKVQKINPDGTFVVCWADDGGGTVQDVQINGATIVQDGVANIPIASRSYHGVIRPWRNISLSGSYPGSIYIPEATKQNMTEREYYAVVQTHQWDEMLKYAMCDGKGPAWTAVEQAAARDRMGVKGYQLFADVVVDEAVSSVSFTLPEESTSAMYIIEVPSEVAHTSTTSQTMYLQSTARGSNNAYVYLGPIVHDERSVVCAKIEKIDDELWVLNYSGVYSGPESTTQFNNRTGRVPPFVVKNRIVKVHTTDKIPKGVLIKIYVR